MDFDKMVNDARNELFACVARRFDVEDIERIEQAYELAEEAHRPQRRSAGKNEAEHRAPVFKKP